MPFWTDGRENSTRTKNVFFTWEKLKNLSSFLNKSGIKSNAVLYDYSPNKIHPESVHIAYELNEFKKSKKINQIIKDNDKCKYYFFFDSDVFFEEDDYEKILDAITRADGNQIYTFDLAKLNIEDSVNVLNGEKINKESMNWNFAYSGKKEKGPLFQLIGGLGGSFFINRDLLLQSGGFDESYETWGGEDGKALNEIVVRKLKHRLEPIRHFFPFHLHHETLWMEPKYFKHGEAKS